MSLLDADYTSGSQNPLIDLSKTRLKSVLPLLAHQRHHNTTVGFHGNQGPKNAPPVCHVLEPITLHNTQQYHLNIL